MTERDNWTKHGGWLPACWLASAETALVGDGPPPVEGVVLPDPVHQVEGLLAVVERRGSEHGAEVQLGVARLLVPDGLVADQRTVDVRRTAIHEAHTDVLARDDDDPL